MKVGTDAVLLGAWADVKNATHILDIGTGTGVIALMLAQRTQPSVKIEAIEIEEHACEDAVENFNASPWANRLTLHQGNVQNFTSTKQFDLIIANPPYFQNSFKPPGGKRITARHTETLTFSEILDAAKNLLTENGTLNVILPQTEGLLFIDLAEKTGLHCSRKWSFRTRKMKPIERWLLEISRKKIEPETHEVLLYENNTGEDWSVGYTSLTRNFYLKL